MKSWLIKFKISEALSARRPLAPAVQQAIARSVELRRFAENASALDHALKSQLPSSATNGPGHAAIMRAVRAANPAPVTENQSAWPSWLAVSIPVVLVLLGAWLALPLFHDQPAKVQPADAHPLAAATAALEVAGSLMRGAPAAAMSPLADEMQRLDRDLVNTREFLVASLP